MLPRWQAGDRHGILRFGIGTGDRMDTLHGMLSSWANFYLIAGSAAAALTGLQFVVQTLLASDLLRSVTRRDPETTIAAFSTPTIVHFGLALLVSTVLCVPWTDYTGLRASLGFIGAGALVYAFNVFLRARRQQGYSPVFEDWLWHNVLPVAAYAAVLFAAVRLESATRDALFAIAAATMLLLAIGLHNAWDTVTYLTIQAVHHVEHDNEPAPPHSNPPKRRRGR
jgi:hypothetical protein